MTFKQGSRSGNGSCAVWIGTALALTLATIAGAQEWRGAGRVKGVVTDAEGELLAGAEVTVSWSEASTSSPTQGPKPRITDTKGRWSFVGLTHGEWTVKIEAEGHITFEDQTTVYDRGGETLRLQLKPIPQEEIEAERLQALNETLRRGNELSESGQHAAARVEYEQALIGMDKEGKPDVLAGIANTYVQEGETEMAISALERALSIDADHSQSLKLMVAVLASQGRDEEAATFLARLPEGASLDSGTQVNLGIMLYNEGKMEEASQTFEEVLATAPDQADAYYYSGLVYVAQEKNDLAIERLKKYLDLAPDGELSTEARDFLNYLEPQ